MSEGSPARPPPRRPVAGGTTTPASGGPVPPAGPVPPSGATRGPATAPSAATRPPVGPARGPEEAPRQFTMGDYNAGFEPREGDALHVRYPTIKLNLPDRYTNIEVGGGFYTRQLREGDNVVEQFTLVQNYLMRTNEAAAQDGVRTWSAEVRKAMGNGGGR